MLPDRIVRVLEAAIVGDAFGVPYEFKERKSYTVEAEMIGGGFWEQAAGRGRMIRLLRLHSLTI